MKSAYSVSALECPIASLAGTPAASLEDALRVVAWMAKLIERVGSADYLIRITEGDRVVEEATASEWRLYAYLELAGTMSDQPQSDPDTDDKGNAAE